ncbi:sensor histidine kinase [Marinimicrobium sp. ABcell2]|uniref:sensor histidine kinase n=1 Tax=Marinimicrobium sp. ABcell2 TaxID=3069751 RepID=UPI0027B00A97|nr:histidine kinase [Marinimicrobium sp. ABcell2]MDQ2076918.1 histidine kinase [Marinimicrobium sp. ABcell2]
MSDTRPVPAPEMGTMDSRTDSDFLPDLCAPQAVLLLVLVAQLLALLLAVTRTGLPQLNWELLALVSFQVQWVVLVSAVILCRLRPRLGRWPPVRAGAVSYGVVLLVTLVFSVLGQLLMRGFFNLPLGVDGWELASNLLTAAILAGIGLRYLYLQQQLRNQQQAELNARIQALQSRIRPHFLFNSMNSIASLIAIDPQAAERAVEDLCILFRASLAEPTLIPLNRELELCRGYIAIEQLRLGARLELDWQIEPLPDSVTVPALLLQPLLENAVFHGVEPLPEGGCIAVHVARSGSMLAIHISNPLPSRPTLPSSRAARHGNRMALDNIRHRLSAHYGPSASLVESVDDARFSLVITYPVE